MVKKALILFSGLSLLTLANAQSLPGLQGDITVPGYSKKRLQQASHHRSYQNLTAKNYTLITNYSYTKVVNSSEQKVSKLIEQLNNSNLSLNDKVAFLAKQTAGIPYGATGAEGEGNWCSGKVGAYSQSNGCMHIQQDPVYRLDQFNCTTLVETLLGLLHSTSLSNFNQSILKIEYGAAKQAPNSIHYCNRNNFVSSALNHVNQHNGFMTDVTKTIGLSPIKSVSSLITPDKWFTKQADSSQALQGHVRVLANQSGPLMANRFTNDYVANVCPKLKSTQTSIAYIPKSLLVNKEVSATGQTSYTPNLINVNKIPTPSVIEFIRDDAKWIIGGKPINQIIGSGINVSHMGIAYRETFNKGDILYRAINCRFINKQKVCTVTPITCQKSQCNRVMLLEATDAYPNGYYYYKQNGRFVCNSKKPSNAQTAYSQCNRVMSIPLGAYFTQLEYGQYPSMSSPSLVGINVQRIKQLR